MFLNFTDAGGICIMKATGIVRRIDDLGRVVIPKEIRRTLRLRRRRSHGNFYRQRRYGHSEKIFTHRRYIRRSRGICRIGRPDSRQDAAVITDRDQVVAVSGGMVRSLMEKQISDRLAGLLEEKNSLLITDDDGLCRITGDDNYSESPAVPR